MWWLVACAGPDADSLLRRHDLDGAAAAWEARTGARLDVDHRVADVLATRAAKDPAVTAATVHEAMEAVRLLEGRPSRGAETVDRPFGSFDQLGGAVAGLARQPVLAVVGRSELPSDRDPYFAGGDLPWSGGRIVGWERTRLGRLARTLEDRPPVRLVTVALRDATCSLWLYVEREAGAWWVRSASDAHAAAALLIAAEGSPPGPGRGLCGRDSP